MKEVAAKVGVSPATVSNAYNRPDQLSKELRVRVLEAASQLGYPGPNPLARGLRRGRAGVVGVLYADRLSYAFADPAAVMFLEGVSTATEEAGLGLLLVPSSSRAARDPVAVGEAVVDGFVIYSMPADDPLLAAAVARRLPAVLVDQYPQGGLPTIGIEDAAAARTVAEHLIQLGHRKFAIISLELTGNSAGGFADEARQSAATFLPSRERLQGYRTALSEAELSWPDTRVYECLENVPNEGYRAAKALLSGAPRPTAILAMSDRLALGVVQAAGAMGLSVPGDLSVVGFDDIPEASRCIPRLTTVRQPHVEKGLKAGQMLISQLEAEDAQGSEILPSRLVVRGSTARA